MAQININMTPSFAKDLKRYMKNKGMNNKSEAIRTAIHEAAERAEASLKGDDYRSWLGLALKVPPASKPRFQSEDDLWS